jgi:prophage DNA circulation protein
MRYSRLVRRWHRWRCLTLWAQQLPQLIRYTRPRPPAALTLAYRLYQDATRASELAALNDAPHPLFMPTQR